ncbi:MAG TPA: PDZ domain-containing protein, partial [Candidatus Angelobacter sp.]|nr:PDZ domain-containing protein [Candidatus Angelobacter sp.]
MASIVFAVINFQKESQYPLSDDGVWWLERNGSILAQRLTPGGPGERAGFKVGDKLLAVEGHPVSTVAEKNRRLASGFGPYTAPTYKLDRGGVPIDALVILDKADTSLHFPLRLIALVYLGIGFYVLFRRWTAPKSTHFYLFCLISFVFYSFHYIGKWNTFDSIIYWSNEVAWLLQPAIFLHFALTFPETRKPLVKRPWLVSLAYLPGVILLAIQIFAMTQLQ